MMDVGYSVYGVDARNFLTDAELQIIEDRLAMQDTLIEALVEELFESVDRVEFLTKLVMDRPKPW